MKIIREFRRCPRSAFRLIWYGRLWFPIPSGQVNGDFSHGGNTVVCRDTPFARTRGRDILFWRFSFSLRGFFSGNGCHIRFYLLDERIPSQSFRVNDFAIDDSAFGQMFPDGCRINIIHPIRLFIRNRFGSGMFFDGRVRQGRRINHPGMRRGKSLAGIGTLHFRKVFLFFFCQIGAAFYHTPDALLYSGPAQTGFFRKTALGKTQTLTIVVHEAACAIQIGRAVPAYAVFILQKFQCFLGGRISGIHGGDPNFAIFIAAATAQHQINIFFGKHKRGGFGPLRACRDHAINLFNLFCFGRKQGKLLRLLLYA